MEVSTGKAPTPAPRASLRLRLEDVEVLNDVVSVGVFGELREAVWTGTPFAARKLPEEEKREEQMKNCLLWNSLNHPNIVMHMGVSASPDGDLWAVTELLTVDLASLLQSSPHSLVPLPFKLAILRDVACAVRYLHSLAPRPLLHGDLQAGHVFLTPSVRAKLDLGDTLFASNQEMRREITQGMLNADLEVIFHLSPEVIAEGFQAVKQSGKTNSDSFSFGVLCLHVLVHEVPIPKEAMIVINSDDAIFFSEQERRSDYISTLQGKEKLFLPIITQCLDPVASHRPSMTELFHRLSQLQPQLSGGKCGESILNGGTMVDVSNHLQQVSVSADAAAEELESFQKKLRLLLGLADDEMVPVPNTPTLPRGTRRQMFDFTYSPPVARLQSLPGYYRRGGRPPAIMSPEREIDEEDYGQLKVCPYICNNACGCSHMVTGARCTHCVHTCMHVQICMSYFLHVCTRVLSKLKCLCPSVRLYGGVLGICHVL